MSEQSHRSDPRVLNRRTVERDHRRLVEYLHPGVSVLDIGCGPGAITSGIARMVGREGRAVGVDRDAALLDIARRDHGEIENLSFENGDVLSLRFENCFDVVNAARTLQWVSEPDLAVKQMARAAKTGGLVVALDYDHENNAWEPSPPPAFGRFYNGFLNWRAANRWSNRMAEELPDLFGNAGLDDVRVDPSDEIVTRDDVEFGGGAAIWGHVIETVGERIAAAGFIAEWELTAAAESYRDFVQNALMKQTLSMKTVVGRKRLGIG